MNLLIDFSAWIIVSFTCYDCVLSNIHGRDARNILCESGSQWEGMYARVVVCVS